MNEIKSNKEPYSLFYNVLLALYNQYGSSYSKEYRDSIQELLSNLESLIID